MTIPLEPGLKELVKRKKHWLTVLWKIIRIDGIEFLFTSHTQNITFQNEVYTPIDSVQSSARRKEADLSVENLELIGVISDATITHDDLRSGRFHEAKITEVWIDYRFPWADPFTLAKYTITEIKYSGERWEAKVEGLTRKLVQPIGRVYGRECDNDLGDAVCRVDTQALSENGTVLAVTGVGNDARVIFDVSGLTAVSDFYTHGRLLWTSGENIGLISVVKLHTVGANTTIELQLPTEFTITVLDAFNLEPGCDKLKDT